MNIKHTAKLAVAAVATALFASVPMISSAAGQFAAIHAAPDGYPAMHYDYHQAKLAATEARGANGVLTSQSEFRHAPPQGYPAANYGDTVDRRDEVAEQDNATTLQAFRALLPEGYPAYGYTTGAVRAGEHAMKM